MQRRWQRQMGLVSKKRLCVATMGGKSQVLLLVDNEKWNWIILIQLILLQLSHPQLYVLPFIKCRYREKQCLWFERLELKKGLSELFGLITQHTEDFKGDTSRTKGSCQQKSWALTPLFLRRRFEKERSLFVYHSISEYQTRCKRNWKEKGKLFQTCAQACAEVLLKSVWSSFTWDDQH